MISIVDNQGRLRILSTGLSGATGATGPTGPAGPSGAGTTAPTITTADYTVLAGNAVIGSDSIEIGDGFILEIGDGAVLEITGDVNPDLGWIDLSFDGMPAGTIDLSALGTIDWYFVTGGSNIPFTTQQHSKVVGGWLYRSFEYELNSATLGNLTALANTITTTLGDDTVAAFSGTITSNAPQNSNGVISGIKMRFPTSRFTQVLHIMTGIIQNTAIITVRMLGSSVASKSLVISSLPAINGQRNDHVKIAFRGNGQDLIVTVIGQYTGAAGGGSFPRVGMNFAWVGAF